MITDNEEYVKMTVIATIKVITDRDLEISEQICCTSFDQSQNIIAKISSIQLFVSA